MVSRGFENFAGIVDSFVRGEFSRHLDTQSTTAVLYDDNYYMYKGFPNIDSSMLSTIRDESDGVVYFMVGFDRVSSPAKIGV